MRPFRGLDWKGTAYHATVIVMGSVIVGTSLVCFPIDPHKLLALLYLAAFTQIAALMPIRWRHGVQYLDTMPLIAIALLSPGSGVTIVAWIMIFDGRRPNRELELWKILFTRAKTALEFGIPSILVTFLVLPPSISVPVKTVLLAAGTLVIGYPLAARGFAFYERTSFWTVLSTSVGFSSIRSVVILAIGGGALFMLLQMPAGYLMGVGLLGLLMAVRSNMTDAQRQQIERIQTLELLAQALDARDPMTESHSQRVADLGARLAEALGMRSLDVERMRVAGLLHDIGKIGVPDSVLKKASGLSHEEWTAMRRHASVGADMIAKHSALAPIAPWVRYHHERWNGSGYPSQLREDAIPLGARILAVADSYDTITGPRVYRASVLSPADAVEDISRTAGQLYDPVVVNALRQLHGSAHLGTTVERGARGSAGSIRTFLRLSPVFTLQAAANGISNIGDPLTSVALVVAAYSLTHSAIGVAATYTLRAVASMAAAAVLGGAADRWDRRRLLIVADIVRAATLAGLPIITFYAAGAFFPAIAVLGATGALAQASREAALPQLVATGWLPRANALIGATMTTGQSIGYTLAALLLWLTRSTNILFLADAATFAAAAALTALSHGLGGGISSRSVTGAFRAAWAFKSVRGPLFVAGASAFLITMTFPALVVLAYHLSSAGPTAYTFLEVVLTLGMLVGAALVASRRRLSIDLAVLCGLLAMGALSVGIGLSVWYPITALLLFLASIGNQVYLVANRTEVQQTVPNDRRGSVMASRSFLTETSALAGSAFGGVIVAGIGGNATYVIAGVGFVVLAAVVALWQRRLTSRPGFTPVRAESASAEPAWSATVSMAELPEMSGGQ
jgi:putative nucleotidyltransferase with HDIG domain